jgi:hypothetical protein
LSSTEQSPLSFISMKAHGLEEMEAGRRKDRGTGERARDWTPPIRPRDWAAIIKGDSGLDVHIFGTSRDDLVAGWP